MGSADLDPMKVLIGDDAWESNVWNVKDKDVTVEAFILVVPRLKLQNIGLLCINCVAWTKESDKVEIKQTKRR